MTEQFEKLSGEAAAERLVAGGAESVVFPIGSFALQFGMTDTEFRAEAASGRLQVRGTRVERGYTNCHVTASDVVLWLAHPGTPAKFREHFSRMAHHDRAPEN